MHPLQKKSQPSPRPKQGHTRAGRPVRLPEATQRRDAAIIKIDKVITSYELLVPGGGGSPSFAAPSWPRTPGVGMNASPRILEKSFAFWSSKLPDSQIPGVKEEEQVERKEEEKEIEERTRREISQNDLT